jgi:hypothetical protein
MLERSVPMSEYRCYKCGSTQVDDGRNAVLSVLGMCLVVGCAILAVVSSPTQPVTDWSTYTPGGSEDWYIVIGFSIGIAAAITGRLRADRVRCRHCRATWTSPTRAFKDTKQ